MKRKTDRTYFIVSLLVVFVSLVVGYAVFAETLNITGTATTTGTFDVEFFGTTVTNEVSCDATSTIAGDKNSLSISVPDLSKPGATATINVVVKNTGNIDAELLGATVTGNSNPNITVAFPTFTAGTVLAAGDTYAFDITVTWNLSSTVSGTTLPFSVELDYEQN